MLTMILKSFFSRRAGAASVGIKGKLPLLRNFIPPPDAAAAPRVTIPTEDERRWYGWYLRDGIPAVQQQRSMMHGSS